MAIAKETWDKLTLEEQRRFKNDHCLKCGDLITEQNYYGSLCAACNEDYFPIDAQNKHNLNSDARFLEFIRDNKERVVFT